jgi:hypothetical protein
MTPNQIRRLERLSKILDEAQRLISELLNESSNSIDRRPAVEFDSSAAVDLIKKYGRVAAEDRLKAMKQSELGAVFVELGGSSADKGRPKVWLVERILWQIFDFEHGHEVILGKGVDKN